MGLATIFSRWGQKRRGSDLPIDVQARLVAPLYANMGTLLVGHASGFIYCTLSVIHIAGPWPKAFLAAQVAVLVLRVCVMWAVNRLPADPAPRDLLRWRTPYRAAGIAWCIVCASHCGFCIVRGDETLRLVAIFFMLGATSLIASRSAGMPRFALTQMVIWLLPFAVVAPLMGYGSWIVLFMVCLYGVALNSNVRQHFRDILALIEAERLSQLAQVTLGESESHLRGIFDNAAAGFHEFDVATNRIVRVNRVFCEMVGRSEADLLDRFVPGAMIHPDERAEQALQWATMLENGRSFDCERRFVRPDGTTLWGRLSASVARWGSDGRPSRLATIIQDITERKVAEAALRASQDLLRLSLDIGGVWTFQRDYVSNTIVCSREARLMHALPLDDVPIPLERWLATVLPEDQPGLLTHFAEAYADRRSPAAYEYRFIHPERGIRYAETRSQVEYDPAGGPRSSVGVVIDITDRRRVESRMVHLAHHDPLTDLPNRSLFRIHLEKALENAGLGEGCAIFCLDLDQFKEVNDTLGHPAGDALLRAVTGRLRAACRTTDTIARLGGDEFAIIQAPLRQREDAAAFGERIIATLCAPYDIDGDRVVIGCSIGIAVAPDDGLDADRLLRKADMALYSVKRSGRGLHRFFEPAMDEKRQAMRALDSDLRQALADGDLELFYQPLVSIATHRIRGFEALLRWRHPERGLVMPDAFIPMAEANGLIVPIGAFVLHHACAQAVLWPTAISVAVNLSASEFTSPHLVETIATALRHSALDPKRLELEITETTMLQDTKVTLETLHRLKALGVRISIDDFGTGFSSLGYLQRFPFDKVKIDRSFITPLGKTRESLAIVGAVVNLCINLDIETTAEGVETESQLAILSQIGCTEAQGFHFSRPIPASDVADLIVQLEIDAAPARGDRLEVCLH